MFLGDCIHVRANGKIPGRLTATMQHDDKTTGSRDRWQEEPVVAMSRRAMVIAPPKVRIFRERFLKTMALGIGGRFERAKGCDGFG